MRALTFLFSAILLAQTAGSGPARRTAAERLGYPPDTKLLIIHADDLAVAHSVDEASFKALTDGSASSASIMVPCPWLTEVGAWARQHPDADLGLHLTLTSEWKSYRWGPVAPRAGLVDAAGNLYPENADVLKSASAADVESEIRWQVERARIAGIRPTHLDSHMGTLFTPKYFAAYVKVARDYRLPFLALPAGMAPPFISDSLSENDIIPDAVAMAPATLKPDEWPEFYRGVVRNLKPGLTELIVHLGHDDAELQAITTDHPAYGSAWRQRDFDMVTSAEFKSLLRDNGVKLIGWRDIGRAMKKP